MVFYTFHISVVSFTWGYYFFPTVLSEKHRLAVSTDPHDGAGSLRKPSKREPSRAELSATWRELTKPRSKSLELQGWHGLTDLCGKFQEMQQVSERRGMNRVPWVIVGVYTGGSPGAVPGSGTLISGQYENIWPVCVFAVLQLSLASRASCRVFLEGASERRTGNNLRSPSHGLFSALLNMFTRF